MPWFGDCEPKAAQKSKLGEASEATSHEPTIMHDRKTPTPNRNGKWKTSPRKYPPLSPPNLHQRRLPNPIPPKPCLHHQPQQQTETRGPNAPTPPSYHLQQPKNKSLPLPATMLRIPLHESQHELGPGWPSSASANVAFARHHLEIECTIALTIFSGVCKWLYCSFFLINLSYCIYKITSIIDEIV